MTLFIASTIFFFEYTSCVCSVYPVCFEGYTDKKGETMETSIITVFSDFINFGNCFLIEDEMIRLTRKGTLVSPGLRSHLPSGPVHPYQVDESISNFRGLVYVFIFILFRVDIPVSKQRRP